MGRTHATMSTIVCTRCDSSSTRDSWCHFGHYFSAWSLHTGQSHNEDCRKHPFITRIPALFSRRSCHRIVCYAPMLLLCCPCLHDKNTAAGDRKRHLLRVDSGTAQTRLSRGTPLPPRSTRAPVLCFQRYVRCELVCGSALSLCEILLAWGVRSLYTCLVVPCRDGSNLCTHQHINYCEQSLLHMTVTQITRSNDV